VDILDLGTPRLTWRRLGVLIRQLPPTSATWVSREGGDALWGLTEQLLAAVVDALNLGNWQRAAAGAAKGQQPKRPSPIARPGVKPEGRTFGGGRSISIAEMRRRKLKRNGKRR
jgi:hypothetical protein